jgi:hypothetical protein
MISQDDKKQPLAVEASMAPKLIRVIAPTNLPGGFQLEVQTDNDPPVSFMATVVRSNDFFIQKPQSPVTIRYSPLAFFSFSSVSIL